MSNLHTTRIAGPVRAGALLLVVGLLTALPARGEVLDRVAAVVNAEIITLREVQRAAVAGMAGLEAVTNPELRAQEERRALEAALDNLIGELLMMQEAAKLRVTVEGAEVDAYVQRVRQQYGWDEAAMAESLRREGSSLTEFRRDVRRRLTTSRMVQMKLGSSVRVSDEEVTQALEREYRGLAKEIEVTARHILLLVPQGADEAKEAEVRKRAAAVLTEARAPGADFEALARARSEGPSAASGGNLGGFTRGTMDPQFEKAAFASEVGAVVGPVRTRYGFHIVQVTRRRELAPKDEAVLRREARGRLRQKAMERAMKRWVQEMRRKAYVDVKLFDE